jgi:hypothetical protein
LSEERGTDDYVAAHERVPETEDERALDEWKAQHWAELLADETELGRHKNER